MADLIDRQALDKDIEETVRFSVREGVASAERRGANKVIYRIQAAPAIDAVEVVRCKDCKYWAHGDCYRLELSRPNDFCSYGERREDK